MEKTGNLKFDKASGRYVIDDYRLTAGDDFEVKFKSGWKWVRIEYSREKGKWYILPHMNTRLIGDFDGLPARIRRGRTAEI